MRGGGAGGGEEGGQDQASALDPVGGGGGGGQLPCMQRLPVTLQLLCPVAGVCMLLCPVAACISGVCMLHRRDHDVCPAYSDIPPPLSPSCSVHHSQHYTPACNLGLLAKLTQPALMTQLTQDPGTQLTAPSDKQPAGSWQQHCTPQPSPGTTPAPGNSSK